MSDETPSRGPWISLVFAFVFFGAGLSVFGLGLLGLIRSFHHEGWVEVPCVIVRFEVLSDPAQEEAFQPDLEYRYEYAGIRYSGSRLRPGFTASDDYAEIAAPRNLLMQGPEGRLPSPEGVAGNCRVDPSQPANSSLLAEDGKGILSGMVAIALGAVFMLVGVVLFWVFRGRAPRRLERWQRSASSGPAVASLFFGIFALIGTVVGWVMARDALECWGMRDWPAVPGTVVWSRIVTHEGDDTDTYSTEIFYRYTVAGNEYFSHRGGVGEGSSSNRGKYEAILAEHPPGAEVQVFVDPDDPQSAVLRRGFSSLVLFSLIPLTFAGFGYAGLAWTWKSRVTRGRKEARRDQAEPLGR